MRSLRFSVGFGALLLFAVTCLEAAEFRLQNGNVTGSFRLLNGNTLEGELVDSNEDGMVVKLDTGGFSSRESWANLSQETLRALAKLGGEMTKFVGPFIELSPDELRAREKKREVVVREVPNRVDRPSPRPRMVSGFGSPLGLGILFVLFLGNLYAAYEIAVFRQRSTAVVCSASAVLPVLAPLIFLALPASEATAAHAPAEETAAGSAGAVGRKTTGVVAPKAASALSLAAAEKTAVSAAHTQPQIYQRGEHTFNRRFFESKFPGFFRVVLGEAERDLVIVVRTVKNEYVGRRISRISSNEMHVQLTSDGSEVCIAFGEVQTVILKHKDAKA